MKMRAANCYIDLDPPRATEVEMLSTVCRMLCFRLWVLVSDYFVLVFTFLTVLFLTKTKSIVFSFSSRNLLLPDTLKSLTKIST